MSGFDSIRLLLCYYYFSAFYIELTSYLLSIGGILLTIIGLYYIPFYIDVDIYKTFFYLNIPYLISIFLLKIVFSVFRCLHKMNDEYNLCGYCLSIIEIYIHIFSIIINLINDIMILSNISFYQKLALNKKSNNYPMLNNIEIISTKVILSLIFFIILNLLLLSIANNILIGLKIKDSYYYYKLSINIELKNTELENNNKNKKDKKKKIYKHGKKEKKTNNNQKKENKVTETDNINCHTSNISNIKDSIIDLNNENEKKDYNKNLKNNEEKKN